MVDLSIIIPAYNMEKYILRAINSALMQNGIEIEIIVVNDGSSDSTRFIAEDIQSIDKRVKLINQSNQGLYRARSNGVKYSKGKYITFIDADDYIDANFYSDLIVKMKDEKIDILEFGYRKINGTEILYEEHFHEGYKDRIEAAETVVTKYNSSCSNCNKIYSAFCLKSHTFDENIRMYEEDMLINLKAMSVIDKYYTANAIGYNYFCRENSITTAQKSIKILDVLDTWECIYDFVKENFPQVLAVCAMTYCARLALYYCIADQITKNPKEYVRLIQRFKDIFNENNLRLYDFRYESKNRIVMIKLFSFSPQLCSFIYRIRNPRI